MVSDGNDSTSAVRLGFTLASAEAVASVYEQWMAIGAVSVVTPKAGAWGFRAVVRDVEGHTVELVTAMKR